MANIFFLMFFGSFLAVHSFQFFRNFQNNIFQKSRKDYEKTTKHQKPSTVRKLPKTHFCQNSTNFHLVLCDNHKNWKRESKTHRFFEACESVQSSILGEYPDAPTSSQTLPIDELQLVTFDLLFTILAFEYNPFICQL